MKEVQPLLGLFNNGDYVNVPVQVLGDGGAQEPEWLHCRHSVVHDGEWGESRGVSLKSTIISTVLSVLSSRLLRLHQTASSLTSCLYADLSPSWMRLIGVVSSANFKSLTEMCSRSCRERRAVGRERSPEELQCWSYGCWMCIFPGSLVAACLSGNRWSTDRCRWAQRAELVWEGGGLEW